MRVNIVYASQYVPPADLDSDLLKSIGSTWGSWRTWRDCLTDNVICNDLGHARELLKRNLQTSCNLYVAEKFYAKLGRPSGLNYYQGNFEGDALDIEDVIAMHLVSTNCDLVLLLGFNLANPGTSSDRLVLRQMKNRFGLLRSCIAQNTDVQWVLVDHTNAPDKAFSDLINLTCDTRENVLKLLV